MENKIDNFTKEIKPIKIQIEILKLKINAITELKNSKGRLGSKLGTAKGRISNMEDTPTENTQAEARRLKNMKIQKQGNIR